MSKPEWYGRLISSEDRRQQRKELIRLALKHGRPVNKHLLPDVSSTLLRELVSEVVQENKLGQFGPSATEGSASNSDVTPS